MNSVNAYFETLLMKVIEEVATQDDFETFAEIVRQDSELRKRYRRDMRVHALLSCRHEARTPTGSSKLGRLKLKKSEADGRRYSNRTRSIWWKVAAAAAAAAALLGFLGVEQMRTKSHPIAVLEMVSGDVSVMNGDTPVKVSKGKKIYSGNEVVVSGKESTAVLVWTDGSTMRLTEGARLLLLRDGNAKKIALLTGCLEGDFTKQEKGEAYSVLTFQGRATVLGTSLRISTDSQDTRLSVVEGKVRFANPSDSTFEDVSSRYEVRVPTDSKEKFAATRFYWADRFSGGSGAGAAARELNHARERQRRAEARFHGQ